MKVFVIGSTGLLGKHLLRKLKSMEFDIAIWNNVDGFDHLWTLMDGAQIVFNLSEYQDFSIVPDVEMLRKQNVDFVRILMEGCERMGISVFIHLSTMFLQCSYWWPNIYGRESENYHDFRSLVPVREYCDSKFEAERIVKESSIRSLIARVGPVYGEGDDSSLICNLTSLSNNYADIPIIGDKMGVFQFTYAGNVASALANCALKILDGGNKSAGSIDHPTLRKSETVLILDETPLKNFLDIVCELSDNRKLSSSRIHLPFTPLFPAYIALEFAVRTAVRLRSFLPFFPPFKSFIDKLAKLPSASYLYLVLHHWTFCSDFKLRVIFEHVPEFDWVTSLRRSREFYSNKVAVKAAAHSFY